MEYQTQFLIVSQATLEPEIHLISPPMHITVATLIIGNVEVSSTTIAYVMNEVILPFWRQWGLVGASEDHFAPVCQWFRLQAMDCIMTEQTAVVILDILISTCSVRPVIDHLAFHRTNQIPPHQLLKLLIGLMLHN